MTPEQDISEIVASVCPDSGHWPYTVASDLYVGFRPAAETMRMASDRTVRYLVRYDLVIVARRSDLALEMEALRYGLYAALMRGGWTIEGESGPETYDARSEEFYWPLTVVKGFRPGADGMPAPTK